MEITNLSNLVKSDVNTSDYLLAVNTATKLSKRFQLSSLFPSISTAGTGSESLYKSATLTNKNQIVFKGLKSADAKMTVTTASDNLVLTLVESQIDLASCNNSSGFLTSVDLSAASGVLSATNGGTGLATFPQGSVLYASATDTFSSWRMNTDGKLLIGNSSTGYPTLGTLTGGTNISITNGPGSITLNATLETLTANLNTDSFNINLATNFISNDGSDAGIYVHTGGLTALTNNGTTLTLAECTAQLNLQGNLTTAIKIGNTSDYQSSYGIYATTPLAGVAGADLDFFAANALSGNASGGSIGLTSGNATGTGIAGEAFLQAGHNPSTNLGGRVVLKSYNSAGVKKEVLVVDSSLNSTFFSDGNLIAEGGLYHRGLSGIIRAQDSPNNLADADGTIAVADVLKGVITCTPTTDRTLTLDTASNLISGLNLSEDNDSFDFTIINLATDGTSDLTMAAGTGVTLVGNVLVKSQNNTDNQGYCGSARIRVRRTSSSAVTLYRIS